MSWLGAVVVQVVINAVVSMGVCANAYPGSGAARSKMGQAPPAGGYDSGLGTTVCQDSPACGTSPASVTASVAASANASRAVPLGGRRRKAPPDDPLENCRKMTL